MSNTHDRPGGDGLDELFELYASPAARRMYDEAVTELDHAVQAATLARADGAPEHLIAAALLHDVGHLVADDNVTLDDELTEDFHHERIGARYLTRWFGPEVTAPVALHVAAKRYLCAVEGGYLAGLSPSSTRSLELQGGPMSPAEVAAFERLPHHVDATRVRRWDDAAKVGGLAVSGLSAYRSLLADLTTNASSPPELVLGTTALAPAAHDPYRPPPWTSRSERRCPPSSRW